MSAPSLLGCQAAVVLECVINVSEGRPGPALTAIAGAAGNHLLDLHQDRDHHRSVLTLAGPGVEEAARAVAAAAVAHIDLRHHGGAHPRIGALDVVPFVPLAGSTPAEALAARDRFARWAGDTLDLPCFLYGPDRTLPEVRRRAFAGLAPDTGPQVPHPSAGAAAVGARGLLVAYNLWLARPDLSRARDLAAGLRNGSVRALGLGVGDHVQVSINLVEPERVGPADVYDLVAAQEPIARAELVGLIPASALRAVPPGRWADLDLDPTRTIEYRLEQAAPRAPIGERD
jgi:glutamate formiminotransferase